jgi:hypothetical protein
MSPLKPKISFKENKDLYLKIEKEIKKLDKSFVKIGVNEARGQKQHPGNTKRNKNAPNDPPTVVQVAFWNEFGTKNIPQRPFLKTSFDQNRSFLNSEIDKELEAILMGKTTVKKALPSLGFKAKTKVIETIDKALTWAAKLAPSTVKAKSKGALRGPNQPLIDSGRLRSSIDYNYRVLK